MECHLCKYGLNKAKPVGISDVVSELASADNIILGNINISFDDVAPSSLHNPARDLR